eukprot:4443877-Amphidinium_carterae.2
MKFTATWKHGFVSQCEESIFKIPCYLVGGWATWRAWDLAPCFMKDLKLELVVDLPGQNLASPKIWHLVVGALVPGLACMGGVKSEKKRPPDWVGDSPVIVLSLPSIVIHFASSSCSMLASWRTSPLWSTHTPAGFIFHEFSFLVLRIFLITDYCWYGPCLCVCPTMRSSN